jgi:translation initiation factor 2B subunit (eIF-2B alpha/beta/delta family)
MELLRNTVGACKWATAAQLMEVVRAVGRELIAAKPSELAVGNVVRRVLFVIREEYASKLREQEECADSSSGTNEVSAPSLETVLGGTQSEADFTVQLPDLKQSIIEGLNELKAELEDVNSIICEHAAETIHANEVVLTFGRSDTVEQFLLAAADQYRKSRLTFRYDCSRTSYFVYVQITCVHTDGSVWCCAHAQYCCCQCGLHTLPAMSHSVMLQRHSSCSTQCF